MVGICQGAQEAPGQGHYEHDGVGNNANHAHTDRDARKDALGPRTMDGEQAPQNTLIHLPSSGQCKCHHSDIWAMDRKASGTFLAMARGYSTRPSEGHTTKSRQKP